MLAMLELLARYHYVERLPEQAREDQSTLAGGKTAGDGVRRQRRLTSPPAAIGSIDSPRS